MAMMLTPVYDALKGAGATEEQARAAAEAVSFREAEATEFRIRLDHLEKDVAELKRDVAKIKTDIAAIKVTLMFIVVAVVYPILKDVFGPIIGG